MDFERTSSTRGSSLISTEGNAPKAPRSKEGERVGYAKQVEGRKNSVGKVAERRVEKGGVKKEN